MDLDFRRDPYLESEANVYGGENIRTGQESFWDTMVPIYSHYYPSLLGMRVSHLHRQKMCAIN